MKSNSTTPFRLLVALLICLVAKSYAQAQPSESNRLIMDGPLLRYFPYRVCLSDSVYATFDGSPLYKESGNCFILVGKKGGTIKFFRYNDKDTLLLEASFLNFRIPNFLVLLAGRRSGEAVEKGKLTSNSLRVEFDNNEINQSVLINEVELSFNSSNGIVKRCFSGGVIPNDVLVELQSMSNKIIVMKIKICIDDDSIRLPAVAYFL